MKNETHFGFTKIDAADKQKRVNGVFDSVASRYDVMNDLMSLGLHRWWKRYAVSLCQIRPFHQVLDMACGSGDLALLMAPLLQEKGTLTLSDINANMLNIAKRRLLDHGWVENIEIIQANAQALPFQVNTFDRIMMSFGLRNVTDKPLALAQLYRVLKPGGRLIILEFSQVTPALSSVYDFYSFKVLPLLGKWVAKDSESYRYLAESIRMHPSQEELKTLILEAGFDACQYHNLLGGVVAVHQGMKY